MELLSKLAQSILQKLNQIVVSGQLSAGQRWVAWVLES